MASPVLRLVSTLFLLATLTPALLGAQSFTCGTSDSTLAVAPIPAVFYPFRPGIEDEHLVWRDIEFMWDPLYAGGLSNDVELTLRRLAHSLVDSAGRNPFGAPYGDMQLIYEYFRREGPEYNLLAADEAAMRFGSFQAENHLPRDLSHIDCYILHPSRGGFDGAYPSEYQTDDEDASSDINEVRHANSIHIKGPPEGQTLDLTGIGWTAPNKGHNVGIMHEFQHGLPPSQGVGIGGGGFSTELFSAAAEAVAGSADTSPVFVDVPYTWPLIADAAAAASEGPCTELPLPVTCVRRMQSNYQGRSLFAAYIAYGFRGGNTLATLTGMSDDLLWRWARSPLNPRTLSDLRNRLSDDSCGTCSTKTYFHPGGVALDDTSRMALLHHNWRVANYVNNSSLDEGQYGYPPEFGLAPDVQFKAWQNNDGDTRDDVVAIPPEVTLNVSHRTREVVVKGERSFGGNTYPLVLQPYGSEYWVVRSDPAIWTAGQDLVLRVSPEGIHRSLKLAVCGGTSYIPSPDARLVASVVAYSPPSDSVASGRLWAHPDWAARALPPRWVDVDSVAGPLEFVVPSFGDSFKAVLVVISLADGPKQVYSSQDGLDSYVEALPYRVDLGVRRSPFQQPNPMTLAASAASIEDFPTWSPAGDEIAFARSDLTTGVSGIYRKSVTSGSPVLLGTEGPEGRSDPDWSPRGDWIAFTRQASAGSITAHVWLVHRWTQASNQLTSGTGHLDVSPAFEPDGQRIAYLRIPGQQTEEPQALVHRQLRRVNLDGSGDILLAELTPADEGPLRWTPDGRFIYFVRGGALYGVPADGGTPIAHPALLTGASSFDFHRGSGPVALEQVGSMLWPTFCGPTVLQDTTWNQMPFRRLALADTVLSDISARFYRTGAEFYNPRWSPEGTRIAYSSNQNLADTIPSDRDLFVGQVSFNQAPTMLMPTVDRVVHTGRPYEFHANASDPDGEALTYQSPSAFHPAGASFTEATRRFYWPSPGPVCSENYVVFRALDGSGGVSSKVIKYTAAIDSVNDLSSPIVGDNDIWLTWTAPGDNGILGRGAEYELRYAQVPLNEAFFDLGTLVTGMAAPAVPGTYENQVISGLSPGTTYYVAIRTRDLKNNWSVLSSVLQITTTINGPVGDYRAHEVRAPLSGSRQARTAISRPGSPDGQVSVLTVEMALAGGVRTWSARELREEEIPALGLGDTTAVLLQARDAGGNWSDQARMRHENAAPLYAVRALARPGRIVFVGSYGVRQAWNSVELDGRGGAARLMTAQHSRLGDIKGGFDSRGTSGLDVAAAESLSMVYEVVAEDSESAQDWYLMVGPPGSEVSTPLKAGSAEARERVPLPTAFRLKQNQPNPFSARTAIHFDLPAETKVRLEVFDAQGRLVRTLADGDYPAGFHAAEWDHRSDGGQTLGAGVYLYRIQAGSFRDQRKMVLLGR